MRRVALFLVAGAGGFLVDAAVLVTLLHFTPLGPLPARAIAIATAMGFTFVFNRSFTFERTNRRVLAQSIRYGAVGTVTALVNYGLYCGLILTVPGLQPVAALVFASLAAMGLSFFGYSRLVFSRV